MISNYQYLVILVCRVQGSGAKLSYLGIHGHYKLFQLFDVCSVCLVWVGSLHVDVSKELRMLGVSVGVPRVVPVLGGYNVVLKQGLVHEFAEPPGTEIKLHRS